MEVAKRLCRRSEVPQLSERSLSVCFFVVPRTLISAGGWRLHFRSTHPCLAEENKKSFVVINQKGIDPPSLEMLAHEALMPSSLLLECFWPYGLARWSATNSQALRVRTLVARACLHERVLVRVHHVVLP